MTRNYRNMVRVICFCGSFKFYKEMQKAAEILRKAGFNVIVPQPSHIRHAHLPASLKKGKFDKKTLTRWEGEGAFSHLENIKKSDAVYIFNKGSYLGPAVTVEIGYALALGKPIYARAQVEDITVTNFITAVVSSAKLLRLLKSPASRRAGLSYNRNMSNRNVFGELTELHVHVGSAVDPPIMWEIAHDQGIKLPTKDYWEFKKLISADTRTTYDKYLELFHWTELIQSSPQAMERSVYSIASGAFRKNNITILEIRFNPMKRNRGGERDLDHIILSAIHGMEKAMIAYPIKVGLIFCLDRLFTPDLNSIIAQKAIKYAKRGVVGIDLAGHISPSFDIHKIAPLFKSAKELGLGITIHTGEATGPDEMMKIINLINPDRIGHGIRAAEDEATMMELSKKSIVLEVCPTSNVNTGVVKNLSDFKSIFDKFKKYKVPFTINTDGPEMLRTNLLNEYDLLLKNNILTKEDLLLCCKTARKASFIRAEN